MKVFVTGGTGFLGRFVTAKLIAAEHDVRIFDLKPDRNKLNEITPGLADAVDFVEGDVCDGDIQQAAQGFDAIIHLAGVMTVDCARDPVRSAMINVIGGLRVFEAAKTNAIKRLSYVSTAGVFGTDDAINPNPQTHYGAQKLAVEGAARAYHLDHGISSTGFRPYIVYGPGQSSGIAAGPSIACAAAMAGEPAVIRFSGLAGFVYVEDVAELMIKAILEPVTNVRVYTLVGETAPMEEFVQCLRAEVPQAKITIEGSALRISGELKTSDMPTLLSLLPVTGIRQGIASTLDFYRERRMATDWAVAK